MLRRVLTILLTMAASGALPAPTQAASLSINRVVPYRNPQSIPAKIRDECQIDLKFSEILKKEMSHLFDEIFLVDDPLTTESDLALVVLIEDMHVPGGGGFGAGKSINIKATLYKDRKMLANYYHSESSRGGALKYFRGGCSILEYIAGEHGEELGDWLDKKLQIKAKRKTQQLGGSEQQ
jgi:hypothetical protein